MNQKKVMKLATEGKRLGAFCIDAAIPFIAGCIMIVALAAFSLSAPPSAYNGFGYGYGYGYGYNYGYDRVNTGGIVAALFFSLLLLIAYAVAQIVFFTKAKTMGKAILGIQVVSSDNGEPIGFWKMLFREWFVKRASAYVFGIGYIWVIVDDKNRGWHDKILDTYVVDLKQSAALNSARSSAAPRYASQDAYVPPAQAAPVSAVPPAPVRPAGPDLQDRPVSRSAQPAQAAPGSAEPAVPAAGTMLEPPEKKDALPDVEKPVLIPESNVSDKAEADMTVIEQDTVPGPETAPDPEPETETDPENATIPE